MVLPNGFDSNINISFVVRNNSSINRSIKVFNTRIVPGGTLDLMKVPGVTEEDVRASVLRGPLKTLLAGGSLKITSSNVNFSTASDAQAEFLASLGISTVSQNSVDNLAELALIDTTSMVEDTEVYVSTYRQAWKLKKTSILALVDNEVINALGGGRWERVFTPDTTWTNQLNWYVDPVSGNDENDGSSIAPVKTITEISRRLRRINTSTYTINLLGDIPSTDRARINPDFSTQGTQDSATIIFLGQRNVLYSGTMTTFSATNTATNTQATITDASADWTTNLGRHVVATSGSANGNTAVILKDQGGGIGRVSEFINEGTGSFANVPVNGTTYDIVSLTSFAAPIQLQGVTVKLVYVFRQLQIDTALVTPVGSVIQFRGCRFTSPISPPLSGVNYGTTWQSYGCSYHLSTINVFLRVLDANVELVGGGGINTRFELARGSSIRPDRFVLIGGSIRPTIGFIPGLAGYIVVPTGSRFGVFDTPSGDNGVSLQRSLNMTLGGALYGSNNDGYAVAVKTGGRLFVGSSITPTVTGTLGDVLLDGVGLAMPPLESYASGSLPALSPFITWSHWTSAPFSRNVMSYKTGAGIINIV